MIISSLSKSPFKGREERQLAVARVLGALGISEGVRHVAAVKTSLQIDDPPLLRGPEADHVLTICLNTLNELS